MLELITGVSLAAAAGLNAYVPLLGLGLLAKYTSVVSLPAAWSWLENGWSLSVLAVLLTLEVLVDKVPALDSVNDVIQTAIRPASGGIVFSAGASSSTVAVADPSAFAQSSAVWPFLIGVLVAFVPHLLKALARPALNLVTAGAGAAAASTLEDIGAVVLTVLAVIVPILGLVLVVVALVWLTRKLRSSLRARRELRALRLNTLPD